VHCGGTTELYSLKMTDSLQTPRVPFCTIFLVVSTVVFNALVLLGNYWTADAFVDIGDSTKGWSKVGLGVSTALVSDLDDTMQSVSEEVVAALEQVISVQGQLDNILSLVGNTTDSAVSNSTALSLLDKHGPKKGMMLLQEMHGISLDSSNASALTALITQAVDEALDQVFDKISELLNQLFETLKPSLIQIANWTSQFSDSVNQALEEFSSTLDKAQKMFDQAMSQLGSSGSNTATMIQNTFVLFDTDDTGAISVENLIKVGEYYTISALSGNKSYELMEKYDTSGDGEIEIDEFGALVQDDSITGAMGIILRNYAKRLAKISGAVGRATQRDEVASSVADYVRLVCAKNETKVEWIADALSNGTLNIDFVGTVMVEMCLKNLDANEPVYTEEDTGATLTSKMNELNSTILGTLADIVANTTWWTSQGLNTQYQPQCMAMFTNWTIQANNVTGESSLLQVLDGVSLEGMDQKKVLEAMPMAAYQLAQESVKLHKLEKMQARRAKRSRMFSTKTGKMLLHRLHHGAMASTTSGSDSDAATQCINSGVAALPSTLLFAKWLSYNASTTANGYIDDCTDYSGESSNAADGFATKVKGFIAKVESFISTFSTYASASGIETIEEKIEAFTTNAVAEVKALVEERLNSLIEEYTPELEGSLHKAAYSAGEKIGTMIGSVLSDPIAQALSEPIEQALESAIGEDAAEQIASQLTDTLGSTISNYTTEYIGKEAGTLIDTLINKALAGGGAALSNALTDLQASQASKIRSLSLAEQSVKRVELKHDLASISSLDAEIDQLFAQHNRRTFKARKAALYEKRTEAAVSVSLDLSSAWTDVYNLMTSFYNLIPQAVSTLKDAREEISELASNLESIFESFEVKGPQIFDEVAKYWKLIWLIYFLFLLPFCAFTLYYGFWASGWFGGPQPIKEDDVTVTPEPPTDFSGRMKVLGSSCIHWCRGFHDTHTCFWSIIIFMQVMVLLTFLVSILLIIVAGVEAMLESGCSTIYVIEDTDSCTQALETVQSLLATFSIGDNETLTDQTISEACDEYSLLTCSLISSKLSKSAIYVSVFSFVASIFSLQMLFDSATLHEQAVCRRKAATLRAKQE